MAYENQTYTLKGIKTALRIIEDKRTSLCVDEVVGMTHIVVELQDIHDLLNDIESAIYGDLEYEDEE